MGLSPEFIANMDPDVNPFHDKGLGDAKEFSDIAEKSKNFYEQLKELFRKNEGQMSMSADDGDLFGGTREDREAALSILEPPKDFESFPKRA